MPSIRLTSNGFQPFIDSLGLAFFGDFLFAQFVLPFVKRFGSLLPCQIAVTNMGISSGKETLAEYTLLGGILMTPVFTYLCGTLFLIDLIQCMTTAVFSAH